VSGDAHCAAAQKMVILGASTLHTESPAIDRQARSQVMHFEQTVSRVHGAARRALAIGVAAVFVLPGSALGQQADSLMVDLGPCVGIESAEQRFDCYEQRVDAALRARFGTAGAAASPAPQVPASRGSATGREGAPPPAAAPARPTDTADEIVATVASVLEIVPNRLQVTLDNGQVWRQTATRQYPVRQGQQVRISQAGLGGYRLTVEELGGFIRVEQLR
jgi:hypothetical protein